MALEQSSGSEVQASAECALNTDDSAGEYWRRCPRCHYFMSCPDFD